jgi:prepilin-type processing-associated H-X9-DG protein
MESSEIRDQMGVDCSVRKRQQAWFKTPSALQAAKARIDTLLCPSVNAYGNEFITITMVNYFVDERQYRDFLQIEGICSGPSCQYPENEPVGRPLGRTNYAACAGAGKHYEGFEQYIGVFTNRSTVRFAKIVDGTSKTILFGEAAGGWFHDHEAGQQRHSFSYSWMGRGPMGLSHGLVHSQTTSERDVFLTGARPGWYQFSSEHPRIVNFCFADGSVHALPITIDFKTLIYLGGYRDGRIVDTTEFN